MLFSNCRLICFSDLYILGPNRQLRRIPPQTWRLLWRFQPVTQVRKISQGLQDSQSGQGDIPTSHISCVWLQLVMFRNVGDTLDLTTSFICWKSHFPLTLAAAAVYLLDRTGVTFAEQVDVSHLAVTLSDSLTVCKWLVKTKVSMEQAPNGRLFLKPLVY